MEERMSFVDICYRGVQILTFAIVCLFLTLEGWRSLSLMSFVLIGVAGLIATVVVSACMNIVRNILGI